jgi:hypothetical protein
MKKVYVELGLRHVLATLELKQLLAMDDLAQLDVHL